MFRSTTHSSRHEGRLVAPVARQPMPLVITSDDQVLDDVLRIAAAASAEVDLAPEASTGRSRWAASPVVIVGPDQAGPMAMLGLPRRPGVFVIGKDEDDTPSWKAGVELGAERVLSLPADESWLSDRLADAVEGTDTRALVVGVVGGRGGAGASIFATALAMTSVRRGLTTMLVDLDLWGGGLDLMLGAEHDAGLRWPDLAGTRGRLSAQTLLAQLPERRGLTVVSSDRGDLSEIPQEAARAVVAAGRRACDFVVLDVPRHLDPAGDEALTQAACTLLVVPTEVRSVAAAARVAASLTTVTADVRTVARVTSPGLSGTDVAAALDLPLAAEVPTEQRLMERLERGDPPGNDSNGSLSVACAQLLDDLGADPRGPA